MSDTDLIQIAKTQAETIQYLKDSIQVLLVLIQDQERRIRKLEEKKQ